MSRRKARIRKSIDWHAVGKRLRELRGDIVQIEFSEQIAVSQGYLSSAERGEREIGPEILLRISNVCGVSIEWLLTGAERKE